MYKRDAMREAKDLIGALPGFVQAIPEPHLGPIWEAFRGLELEPGKIPAKYQQLVMLAVAIHARCEYGRELHAEIARSLGATPEELTEVALLAAHTSTLSHVLWGMRYGQEEFRREVRALCQVLSGGAPSRRTLTSPRAST